MNRLLLLCGSQRTGSLNARLLDLVGSLVPAGFVGDRVHACEIDLPLFDQDRERDPELQQRLRPLHARFGAAAGLIVASPEYNGLMTPFLKNTIDWVSRLPRIDPAAANAFLDRPVLLLSATPGWSGGALGIAPLRALFGYLGAVPFGETISLPFAEQAWAPDGTLDPMLPRDQWADCVRRFCSLVGKGIQTQSLSEAA